MRLDKELFDKIAIEAALSPKLRKNFDLRDSENENSQRMLNVLCPGTQTPIHRHNESSEIVLCISGSVREHFYNKNGEETDMVELRAGGDTPGVVVEIGRFHSLEATNEIGVVFSAKAGLYEPLKQVDIIKNDTRF